MMQHKFTAEDSGQTSRPVEPKRAEQRRAQETRSAILDAALAEFASRHFDAASIRSIADRIGLQHPLITYHFRTKEILWRAVAEYVFERIRRERDANLTGPDSGSAVERVKLAYRALFHFTVEYPEFHRFMLQEALGCSPRLQWTADTLLKPLIDWLLPQIRAAQDEQKLPRVEPIIFHYMLISLTSTLSGFGPEISATSNLSPLDPAVVDACWKTVEQLVF
ncbi:TetR/AcrR family transcriptional regulator [Paraburkholderia sp. DGU8]|uniref:TetR/AcrR family transcriptional regulator n=1 Tax=Paraburkholderia sp. DGU8 TaxID=3161997 RepID=UPI0034673670